VSGSGSDEGGQPGVVIGIDASNLRRGGGRTHLIELLRAADPPALGVKRVVLWGGRETLAAVEDRTWLEKVNPSELEGGLLRRTLWQRLSLPRAARAAGCGLLFVPGASSAGTFHPVVVMSRNMLPFEWAELRRFGWSRITLRLLLLRMSQSRTFRAADGVVFLTNYAAQRVTRVTGALSGAVAVIAHGLNRRFSLEPRPQRAIEGYSDAQPFRIVYVSIIDQYKHQWQVVEALGRLRQRTAWPLALDLVGPAYPPAMRKVDASLDRWDPDRRWVRLHGDVPHAQIHRFYAEADLGVFASSCENMPNILLENMAAGLPVACSHRGPMPEILGEAGVYFDPLAPDDIARAVEQLIASPEVRTTMAAASYRAAQHYSWERCAQQTFAFLTETVRRHRVMTSKA
jgi:glycosyltransferase involved in cell wall biosynthesis